MITRKLIAGARISPGTVVHLTFEQFDARRHLLKPLEDLHTGRGDKQRRPYTSEQGLFFKAGEEIGVEGTIDRQLQAAFGASDEDLVKAKAARPGVVKSVTAAQKGQLTKARNRLKDAESDAAEAQRALEAAPEAKKDKAAKALEAAKAAVADARTSLDELEQRYGVAG